MTARKKELVQMDDFISLGGMELAKQTPAQRGIQAAEDPKGNKNPKYPKSDKRQKEPNDPKDQETSEQPKEPKYPKNNKEPKANKRVRWCVNLDEATIEWAKRAVYNTPGLTLSELVEQALIRELGSMERKRGEAFPAGGKVKVGRPMKM